MYLEISGRQTGKSTRLVNNVIERVLDGDRCIIFGFTSNWTSELKNKVLSKLDGQTIKKSRVLYMPEFFTTKNQFRHYLDYNDVDLDELYFYYDEFDMYREEVILSDKGYYVTTAIHKRTLKERLLHSGGVHRDTLLDLEKMNNYMIVSVGSGFSSFDDYENVRYLEQILDDQTFNRDIENNWNTYKVE